MAVLKRLYFICAIIILIITLRFALECFVTNGLYSHNIINEKISKEIELSAAPPERTSDQNGLPIPTTLCTDDIPTVSVMGANCSALFEGDADAIRRTQLYQERTTFTFHSSKTFQKITSNCSKFISTRKYITKLQTKMEEAFPIAYGIAVYKDVAMLERVLRVIYRPQNYYCIHVDKKANTDFQNDVASLVKCFDNVFLSSRQTPVKWGSYSVLEANLICMEDMLKLPKWKYFINLTGQEFPLRTNLELVKILKSFNGANGMESIEPK